MLLSESKMTDTPAHGGGGEVGGGEGGGGEGGGADGGSQSRESYKAISAAPLFVTP